MSTPVLFKVQSTSGVKIMSIFFGNTIITAGIVE